MKKIFFPLGFVSLLFYLCACNNSDTGKTSENKSQTTPELKAVFINGDSIHYIDIGKGDPVVFVHPGASDYRIWEAQMDAFSQNHRVIAYSRRHAYPNKQIWNDSADYSRTLHSKDLAEFIKSLNLEPVHLVGHSYGAAAALFTTIDHPELVRSLTLGEPALSELIVNLQGSDTIFKNFGTGATAAFEAFKNNDEEKAVSKFLDAVTDDSLYFSNLPQRHREILMANTLELRGVLLGKRKDVNPTVTCDDLKKIKTPVLLLGGDKSPSRFSLIFNTMEPCLSNKERATLSNTNHGLEMENPVEFNKIVLGFIDKH